jgi:hypothetical protein
MESQVWHNKIQTVTKYNLFLIITLLITLAISPVAGAEEAHEEGSHEFHRHHMALILGNTQNDGSESGLSVGLDYEYRFNKWMGTGGLAEYAGGDFKHLLLFVPLYIHPYKDWLFVVAGGTEIHKEHEGHDEDKRTRDWVVRTGVAYHFPFGEKYTIAPEFNVDFSENETLFVYGIAIGVGF